MITIILQCPVQIYRPPEVFPDISLVGINCLLLRTCISCFFKSSFFPWITNIYCKCRDVTVSSFSPSIVTHRNYLIIASWCKCWFYFILFENADFKIDCLKNENSILKVKCIMKSSSQPRTFEKTKWKQWLPVGNFSKQQKEMFSQFGRQGSFSRTKSKLL